MDSKALADLILADLDTIVARTRGAYLERVPRLRQVSPAVLDEVLEATRRTMHEFCRYYLAGTLDAEGWRRVRDATLERAGEHFTHAEILEIIDTAHAVGVVSIEQLADAHPDLSAEECAEVTEAISRYIIELAEQEDRLRRLASPGRLDDILDDLEREGADLQ
jgi:hypothetical protein